jgi:hypothetical protein
MTHRSSARDRVANGDDDSLTRTAALSIRQQQAMVPCRNFVRNGTCPQGDGCRFSHHSSLRGATVLLDDATVSGRRNRGGPAEAPAADPSASRRRRRGPPESPSPSVDAYSQLQDVCEGLGKVKLVPPQELIASLPWVIVKAKASPELSSPTPVRLEKGKPSSVLTPRMEYVDLMELSTCTICLESFHHGDRATRLPCGHFHHQDCITSWIQDGNNKCPVCRGEIFQGPCLVPAEDSHVAPNLRSHDRMQKVLPPARNTPPKVLARRRIILRSVCVVATTILCVALVWWSKPWTRFSRWNATQ